MPQIANGDSGAAARALINALLPYSIGFTTAVPLDGRKVMAPQAIAGALAFAPAGTPALGADCCVRLTADGTHPPSFAGFVEHGSSAGFVNTVGIVNLVRFWNDGVTSWYAIAQALNVVPLVMQSAIIANGAPTQIVVTFGHELNGAIVPPASAFTLTNSGGDDSVTAVSIAGATVTLTKSRTTLATDATIQLGYTQPGAGALADSNGSLVGSCSLRVTNGITPAANYLRFTGSNLAETADPAGGFDYGEQSAASYGSGAGKGVADKTLAAGTDGYVEILLAGSVVAGPILALQGASTVSDYTAFDFGAYASNGQIFWLAAATPSAPTPTQPGSVAAAIGCGSSGAAAPWRSAIRPMAARPTRRCTVSRRAARASSIRRSPLPRRRRGSLPLPRAERGSGKASIWQRKKAAPSC